MTAVPFRAEHVGSFLRPDSLLDAVRAHRAGRLDADGLRAAQDAAIRDIVAFQDGIGMPAVTDGEFRRRSWSAGVIDALDGFALREEGVLAFRSGSESGGGGGGVAASPYAARRLERKRAIVADDYRFLASLSPKGLPKVTIASPPVLHFFLGPRAFEATAYADRNAYFADLVGIYRDEIADLAAAGCRYVQLDDTALPCNCDDTAREGVAARGEDPDELTDAYVDLINAAVAERPAGMLVGLHMCRGNFKGAWMAEGGYEPIAERVFQGLDVDILQLEYDTPRAGDFAPLRFLPKGKTAVLGLISTKTPVLEDKDSVKRRIDEAARFAPLDRLAIGPQCGFSSAGGSGQPIDSDDTRRKLDLVLTIAREVWGTP